MITLEELDSHKRGMTEVARNARQVSRDLDALAANMPSARRGRPLGRHPAQPHRPSRGRRQALLPDRPDPRQPAAGPAAGQGRQPDPRRRQGAASSSSPKRDVVLVSKDINMRIKARALGLPAEDYFNDKTLDDGDLLYTGMLQLPADFWDKHAKTVESWQQGGLTYYRIGGDDRRLAPDQPVRLPRGAGRAVALRQGDRDHRQDRGAAHAQGLHPPEELDLGRRRRATATRTSRFNLLMDPGVRLHHAHRHRRLGQDADVARRRAWRR